jgi:hypothetical protein
VEQDTSDSCTPQCVSTVVSCQHSEESRDSDYLRVDTLQHVSTTVIFVAGDEELVDGQKLAERHPMQMSQLMFHLLIRAFALTVVLVAEAAEETEFAAQEVDVECPVVVEFGLLAMVSEAH